MTRTHQPGTNHGGNPSGPDDKGAGPSVPAAQAWLHAHLEQRKHPLNEADVDAAAAGIEALQGTDPTSWAATWSGIASDFEARAVAAEADDDPAAARQAWWQAYVFSFLGRYPSPLGEAKAAAYDRARAYFLKATTLDDPPAERVVVPFDGRPGEGREVAFYVGRPKGISRPPVVLMWGGIDMWKEESYGRGALLRSQGIATIHVDMPGVGESPVLAGIDAERQWDPVFEWIAGSDLDAGRVALLGQSFGGYWAMKLAHTHRDRLVAAVNWGGGVHITFQPDWQEKSRHASSYLMDLMPTRARIFGGSTFEEYVAACPQLSLLSQGVLDQPSCPLLLTNGIDDQQNSAEDIHLSLQHGDPKTARLFPGGHMGEGPVMPTVLTWLRERLGLGQHRNPAAHAGHTTTSDSATGERATSAS